ncbi:ribose 5-phosphate isomerase B [Salicibibacter halophilus]|uniref:Ribose 5-phosphate isomerase B n=1 Tax=Salicibibacter halophilus TaxID=2502791 RepID=A0A514LIT5_9BACI|nr:ribose 5-phosphate isomerase B [Salicibibacter halophilus]QDI91756.1 ribose 5-phosphate isomerase B [Salicibibacter halophilus]
MKIIIGSDHAGWALKKEIFPLLENLGIEYKDVGTNGSESVDYPDYAKPVAEQVSAGDYDLGILICGTGIGMSMTANKVPGIRCALANDVFSAEMSRLHNQANVLAIGERVIGPGLAKAIVEKWVSTEFEGGRHANRVEKVMETEQ